MPVQLTKPDDLTVTSASGDTLTRCKLELLPHFHEMFLNEYERLREDNKILLAACRAGMEYDAALQEFGARIGLENLSGKQHIFTGEDRLDDLHDRWISLTSDAIVLASKGQKS